MRLFQLVLLSVVFGLCSISLCLAAESGVMDVPPELSSESVQDTLGVGVEGYGSPVRSGSISSGELYSSRSGYLHPFVSVGGLYTDNLFNTENDEKSDWVTVVTPGIWLARPASRQKLAVINTLNTAPGGLALSRFLPEDDRRLQTYALYRADIREHDKYTSENRIDHRVEGMVRLALRGGLTFELADVYEVNRDPYGTGGTLSRELDKYTSNLFTTMFSYKLTPKFSVRADYGHYFLDYDETRNEYRNREDDSVSAYLYYRVSPKTSVFLQTEYIVVNYDTAVNSDSDSMHYYVGVQLRPRAKLRGQLKIGYGQKDYDVATVDDRDEFLYEARIDYFFTPKTSVYLKTNRRVLETDSKGFDDILSHKTQIGYRQRFSAKWRGEAALYFANDEYSGATSRDDDRTGFVAAIGFAPKRWLNLSLGYEFEDRDSDVAGNDYQSNQVFLRATAAL